MKILRYLRLVPAFAGGLAVAIGGGATAAGTRHEIDPAASTLTVHVEKTGLLRMLGDDHVIRAPITSGVVDDGPNASVEVEIDASQMRVLDPKASDSDRQQVQQRMLGPQVLDVAQYPQIRFQSTEVDRTAEGWRVVGQLTLHGTSRPVVVSVTEDHGHYRGTASFKQTSFGITPVSVAGGAVKVKDEVSIEFDIATRSKPSSLAAPLR